MAFATRLSLIMSVVLGLAIGALIALAMHTGNRDLLARQQSELGTVGILLRNSLDRSSAYALTQVEAMARQADMRQALERANRSEILERFREMYAYLRSEAGVEIMQFQGANLRTIARLHDPGRFDDDVSVNRPMVVAANRMRRGQRGIEIGPTGTLALRGVAPVIHGEQLLGTAEIGFALRPLLQAVKSASGAEVAIFASAAMTQGQGGGSGGEELQLKDSTDSRVFEAIAASPAFRLARDSVQFEAVVNGERWGVIAEPLLDYSGRMIGGIVGAKNATAAHRTYQRDMLIFIFVGLCGLVLAFSVVMIALRGFILGPLNALSAHAEKLATSQDPGDPPRLGGSKEVTRVLSAFLTLTKSLSEKAPQTKEAGDKA